MDFFSFVRIMRDPRAYLNTDGEIVLDPLEDLKQHLRQPVFYWPYEVNNTLSLDESGES